MKLSPLGLKAAYEQAARNVNPELTKLKAIRDIFQGEPPFSDTELREHGRAEMSNINTRGFKLAMVNKLNRWKSMAVASKPQVSVSFAKHPDPANAGADADTLAHILTKECLLKPAFLRSRFSLYRDAIMYGSGVLAFDCEDDIYPTHIQRSALVVPADAAVCPEKWDRAYFRATKTVAELYEVLPNGDEADKGYKADAVKILLMNYQDAFAAKRIEQAFAVSDWEARSILMDRGMSNGTYDAATIPVIVGYFHDAKTGEVWKRVAADLAVPLIDHEMKSTGEVSATGEQFLYEKKLDWAEDLGDVFHVMGYTEEEEKLWLLQGHGHDIYDIECARLRVENNSLDAVDMAKPVIESSDASTGEAGNIRVDRFIHLPATSKVNVGMLGVDPTLSLAMGGRLGDQAQALGNTTPPPSALSAASKQPLSAAEVQNRMSTSSEQEEAEAATVSRQDDKLLAAVCRRALKIRDNDELTNYASVYRNVKRRIAAELIYPDAAKDKNIVVSILPGVGSGSARDRQQRIQVAYGERGSLSAVGRENLTREFFSEVLGGDRIERYVPKLDPRRIPVKEAHDARQENLFFELGKTPAPAADDNHLLHAQIHLTFLMERAQAVQQAEQQQQGFNAAPLAQTFEMALPHLAYHIDQVGAAANAEQLQTEHKGLMASLAQLNGLGQRLKANAQGQAEAQQKQQQQMMEQQAQQQQQLLQRIDSQALTIQKMQADHTIAQQKFEAAQRVREQESMAKIERSNRELEAKIRKLENSR